MGSFILRSEVITDIEAAVVKKVKEYSSIYGIDDETYEIEVERKESVSYVKLLKCHYDSSAYMYGVKKTRVYRTYGALGKFILKHPFIFDLPELYAAFQNDFAESLRRIESKLRKRKEWAESLIRGIESRAESYIIPKGELLPSIPQIAFACPHAVVLRDKYKQPFRQGIVRFSALFSLGFHQATLLVYPESFYPICSSMFNRVYAAVDSSIRRRRNRFSSPLTSVSGGVFLNVPYTKKGLEAALDLLLYEGDLLEDYVIRGEDSFVGRVLAFSEPTVEDPYDEVCAAATRSVNDFFTHAVRMRGMR